MSVEETRHAKSEIHMETRHAESQITHARFFFFFSFKTIKYYFTITLLNHKFGDYNQTFRIWIKSFKLSMLHPKYSLQPRLSQAFWLHSSCTVLLECLTIFGRYCACISGFINYTSICSVLSFNRIPNGFYINLCETMYIIQFYFPWVFSKH